VSRRPYHRRTILPRYGTSLASHKYAHGSYVANAPNGTRLAPRSFDTHRPRRHPVLVAVAQGAAAKWAGRFAGAVVLFIVVVGRLVLWVILLFVKPVERVG